jgi:formylglycine-generating enzyme
MSKTFSLVLAVCAAMFLTVPVHAQVTITLVAVGDTNNAADTTVMVTDTTSGYGSVTQNYSISAFDITIAQYTAMLNAVGATDPYGLWNSSMAAGNPNVGGISRTGAFGSYSYSVIGTGTNPVTNVTWLDAARFCNWLQNGQPATGVEGLYTTETGAYALDGDTTSGTETAASNAEWFIPTEDEWYKAAYYDPTISGSGGYWTFPTASNTTPGNDFLTPAVANQANFIAAGLYSVTQSGTLDPTQNYLTPVGSFTNSSSHYGTFDQGGDAYNWNDSIISGTARGLRGGAWDQTSDTLQSDDRESRSPLTISPDIGFRVASTLPPTPMITSSLSATGTSEEDFTYTVTATNNPTSFDASGLPGGLSIVSASGIISGTPTSTGTFPVVLAARNTGGVVSGTLSLVIVPLPTPVISSSLTATGSADEPFSYTIAATGNPTSYGASPLPPGLVVTTTNGLISGTPTQTGTFSSTISAINSSGTGTATLAFDFLPPSAPVISSTLNVTGTEGTPFDYQIGATFGPTAFTSGTLPTGLSLDGSTGLISGTPTENGTFSAAISAINLAGTGTGTLALTILPPSPSSPVQTPPRAPTVPPSATRSPSPAPPPATAPQVCPRASPSAPPPVSSPAPSPAAASIPLPSMPSTRAAPVPPPSPSLSARP